MSSHLCIVCRDCSLISVSPRTTRIRTVCVPSSALTLASCGIFRTSARPVDVLWAMLSTPTCPAAISFGTASQKACSPSQRSFHCSFSMCHTPSSQEDLLPPMASIRHRSLRSSRVASAQLVPSTASRPTSAGPHPNSICKSCMHLATLVHFVPSVWSHFHSPISCCRSCNEAHAHVANV